ncbi:hypothetical protein [Streptomyces sp. NPDC020965]|uniref:hypothetical protein n=1 Tax=Streptomyces sp. NPDC020965 TaxID=3365105 RepID=UPI0037AD08F4
MNGEAWLLGPAVVLGALAIRTAVTELRRPGTAREQWAFLQSRRALFAGAAASLVAGAVGWHFLGAASAAWAVLTGLLVALIAAPRV